MTSSDDTGAFEFDPEQTDPVEELAEAFIHEEFDAALLAEIDREALESLVARAEARADRSTDDLAEEAALEVARIVLARLEAFED
jgi:hypothetical protein